MLEDMKEMFTYLSYQHECACFDLKYSIHLLAEVTSGLLSRLLDVPKLGLPFYAAKHELQLCQLNSKVLWVEGHRIFLSSYYMTVECLTFGPHSWVFRGANHWF